MTRKPKSKTVNHVQRLTRLNKALSSIRKCRCDKYNHIVITGYLTVMTCKNADDVRRLANFTTCGLLFCSQTAKGERWGNNTS